MSNKHTAITNNMVIMNVLYKAGNMILLFLVNMLLTRLLGVSGFGALSLLIINVGIFNLVSGLGIDSSTVFYGASEKMPGKSILGILWSGVAVQLLLLCFGETIAYLVSGKFLLAGTSFFHEEVPGMVLVISLSVIEKYTALFNARFRSVRAARLVFTGVLVLLMLLAGAYFLSRQYSAAVIINIYVYAFLLQALLFVLVYHWKERQPFALQWPGTAAARTFFSYSVIAFVTNIIQFLAYRVDYWVLDHYHGNTVLGWYALSVKLVQFFWALPLLLAGLIFPAVAKREDGFANEKMQLLLRMINSVNVAAALLAIPLTPLVLPFLFGSDYTASVRPFLLLLPGTLLFCNAIILAAYFAGKKKLRTNFRGSMLCLLVIAVLDILLIPKYGIDGAVLANNIAYGITGIYFVTCYWLEKGEGNTNIFLLTPGDLRSVQFIFKSRKPEA